MQKLNKYLNLLWSRRAKAHFSVHPDFESNFAL